MRSTYKTSASKFHEKRQLQRPGHIWESNIKMVLMEVWCYSLDCIQLIQDRIHLVVGEVALMNTILNRHNPKKVGGFLSQLAVKLSWRNLHQ
jgi:hypothetical protein